MKEFFEEIWELFKPPRAYCWQTLFRLSLFSAVMSAISMGFVGEAISIIGYVFLIVSLAWLGIERRWQLTPWLVSALICLLLWGLLKIEPQILILLWFPLSALVASLASFISRNLEFKFPRPQEGQAMIILLEIQILLACWMQFYFLCNHWLQQYPSLLAEDFSKSQFVLRWNFSSLSPSRGQLIVAGMQTRLEQQINNRPWSEVESWLQTSDREDVLLRFQNQVLEELNAVSEGFLWKIESQWLTTKSEYQFQLVAQWLGPRSNDTIENKSDRTELICNVRQENNLARMTCNISENRGFTNQK